MRYYNNNFKIWYVVEVVTNDYYPIRFSTYDDALVIADRFRAIRIWCGGDECLDYTRKIKQYKALLKNDYKKRTNCKKYVSKWV